MLHHLVWLGLSAICWSDQASAQYNMSAIPLPPSLASFIGSSNGTSETVTIQHILFAKYDFYDDIYIEDYHPVDLPKLFTSKTFVSITGNLKEPMTRSNFRSFLQRKREELVRIANASRLPDEVLEKATDAGLAYFGATRRTINTLEIFSNSFI
jgi:hypothetical protein